MNGLDLEPFLHLLRADFAAWSSLAVVLLLLALISWTSWGSRRALRKCLVLSIAAHAGLVIFGGPYTLKVLTLRPSTRAEEKERIREIRIAPKVEGPEAGGLTSDSVNGRPGRRVAPWDRPGRALALADPSLRPRSNGAAEPEPMVREVPEATIESPLAEPKGETPDPPRPDPPKLEREPKEATASPPDVAPVDPTEIPDVQVAGEERPTPASSPRERMRPDRMTPATGAEPPGRTPPAPVELPKVPLNGSNPPLPEGVGRPSPDREAVAPLTAGDPSDVAGSTGEAPRPKAGAAMPEVNIRDRLRGGAAGKAADAEPRGRRDPIASPMLARAVPSGPSGLADLPIATSRRPLANVPEVYRIRLDPNRSALAKRAGASNDSEQAVERALDWLHRHQDLDGRWDGGTSKVDGVALAGEDSFTIHCPAGEICFGECHYSEADTAMTGLALLAYLGAGYTHTEGKYAQTVGKGVQFLLSIQTPNGDLRGESRAVGMYCHCMATLALCEAYALTGDPRLKAPVTRAVEFLAKARARDGMSWRYEPYARSGDTSILGWVVMVFKSARLNGIPVPPEMQAGALAWLKQTADGESDGLGRYRPYDERGQPEKVTPTMTAESWVIRQFLGVGGPGPASAEAADYLLARGPDREAYNLYYYYYATLAMYQNGGNAWQLWNGKMRDELVRRQHVSGHRAGSWDPDADKYGSKGGRIYSTALAALTLEVYYRYLRLYDTPDRPPVVAPAPEPRPADGRLRRAGAP